MTGLTITSQLSYKLMSIWTDSVMTAQNLNLTQHLVQELGKSILNGTYSVGSTLPSEADICQQFDVSRTATREAVKMLTAKGLISSRPRQGIRVLPRKHWNMFDSDVLRWVLAGTPDLYTLRDFLQLRMAIEPQAAFLAAENATDINKEEIKQALARMKSAEDGFDDTLEADIEFHKSIFEATNNPFFIQLKNFIETTLRVNIRFTNRKQAVTSAEYQVHQDIYQAIVDGNAQLAWQSASQTQQATMALVEKQLKQLA